MNTWGLGVRGARRGAMPTWRGSASPFRRLQGALAGPRWPSPRRSVATGPRGSGGWIGAQDPQLLGLGPDRLQGSRDRSVAVPALEVGEEHVVAQALLAGARLDHRQVDASERELRQAAHQPARRVVAHAPE